MSMRIARPAWPGPRSPLGERSEAAADCPPDAAASRRRPLGARLTRLALGLPLEAASFECRGFRAGDPDVRRRLERVGRTFIEGYNAALDETAAALVPRLEATASELRGFAFEGAAMALALLDALTPWRRDRHERFLRGAGAAHVYMVHVGAGWALARLRLAPARYRARTDALLGWLAVDGYGFHEGYFRPARSFVRCHVPTTLRGYERRVFDQGLGRSLWFVECAGVERIAARIRLFAPQRRADLWSGVGLACAYAGVSDSAGLLRLRELAGPYWPHLAQGAAFAAQARDRAGNQTAHTEHACLAFCGTSAASAAAATELALRKLPRDGPIPAYEEWRTRIRRHFAPRRSGALVSTGVAS